MYHVIVLKGGSLKKAVLGNFKNKMCCQKVNQFYNKKKINKMKKNKKNIFPSTLSSTLIYFFHLRKKITRVKYTPPPNPYPNPYL